MWEEGKQLIWGVEEGIWKKVSVTLGGSFLSPLGRISGTFCDFLGEWDAEDQVSSSLKSKLLCLDVFTWERASGKYPEERPGRQGGGAVSLLS